MSIMKTLMGLAGLTMAGFMLLSCNTEVKEANYQIIPLPQEISVMDQAAPFILSNGTKIMYPEGNEKMQKNAEFLASYIKDLTGKSLAVQAGTDGKGIILQLGGNAENPEGYQLKVTSDQVVISGPTEAGVFYGIQTLRKSIPVAQGVDIALPAVEINDYPRFSYRGAMLDVSRHFFPVDSVKRFIDMLALHNINRFHWHLSEDQGWRIEIKSRPELTEIGSKRAETVIGHNSGKYDGKPYGGFFTQEEAKEIVAYAAERHITVIPEIDMPGHMLAAVSNYEGVSCFNETGWGSVFSSPVCPGKDSALEFCKNIYAELIALFPYKYVHIGGDEVEKTNWKKCPDCQKRMHDNNLKTEEELQSWFIHDMERFFNGKGKEMIGWDEIIEGGLSKTATVMWWRSWVKDAATKATAQGNPVIFTPNGQFYLDYAEDKNSMASIYNLDTTDNLTPEQQSLILGVQGNIWCEWIPSNARMQYMAIPRLLAIAELGWSKPEQKDWNAFKQRLSDQFERLNIMGINYRIPDLEGFNAVNAFIGEGTINVTCLDPTAEIHYTTDGSTPTLQSPVYEGPIKVTETTDFTFCTFRPNGKKGDIAKTRFIKSEYTPSVTAAPSNPGLKATWHEFKGNKCSEIEKAPVNGTYPVEDVMIPKKVKGNIGLIIKGYFNAPQDDIYTFALLSDDGSTLTIDSEQIVDNDGPHGPKEIVGQKALAKGYHPMELRYFDQNGGQLKLKVTGSDGKEIPFTHLYAH